MTLAIDVNASIIDMQHRLRRQRIATEGALLGSALNHGLSDELVILSDSAIL